jgi:hypothetical protein
MAKSKKAFILYYPLRTDILKPYAVILAISREEADKKAEELLLTKEFALTGVPLVVE